MPVKLPVPPVNVMFPVGVENVPGEVSVIVTVQLVVDPIGTGQVHDTAVATVLGVTLIVAYASGFEAECLESPP